MARSSAIVEALKGELRARKINYEQVAKHLRLSEASVKRLFSREDFTLERIDRVCELLGMEFSDLARNASSQPAVISRLTHEQEKEFVANPKLMLVALLALNHWTFEDMVKYYDLSAPECIRLLARLDRLRFIELMPKNRIRLLVSQAFSWIPDGPIQRLFKERVHGDFFDSKFAGEHEFMVLATGALSRPSINTLLGRLRRAAADFSEMRTSDASLQAADRVGVTVLLAARPWEAPFVAKYRRRRATNAPAAQGRTAKP